MQCELARILWNWEITPIPLTLNGSIRQLSERTQVGRAISRGAAATNVSFERERSSEAIRSSQFLTNALLRHHIEITDGDDLLNVPDQALFAWQLTKGRRRRDMRQQGHIHSGQLIRAHSRCAERIVAVGTSRVQMWCAVERSSGEEVLLGRHALEVRLWTLGARPSHDAGGTVKRA